MPKIKNKVTRTLKIGDQVTLSSSHPDSKKGIGVVAFILDIADWVFIDFVNEDFSGYYASKHVNPLVSQVLRNEKGSTKTRDTSV